MIIKTVKFSTQVVSFIIYYKCKIHFRNKKIIIVYNKSRLLIFEIFETSSNKH